MKIEIKVLAIQIPIDQEASVLLRHEHEFQTIVILAISSTVTEHESTNTRSILGFFET